MDVIERSDCAIENFEALLQTRTEERELVNDALLRLVRLHRAAPQDEALAPLLRRFWDAGRSRGARGQLPWSMRFVPPDFDVVYAVELQRVGGAGLWQRLGPELREALFVCDPARRRDLEDERRFARAERKAAATGRDYKVILYEDLDRERARQAQREAARARGRPRQPTPIAFESVCEVAMALGYDDVAQWQRLAGAMPHGDFGRSIALAEIDGVEARLRTAVDEARLLEIGVDHWGVPGLQYEGQDVELARLDEGELLIAPAGIIDGMIAARASAKRTMSRTLAALVERVPQGTAFFAVLGEQAVFDLGLGALRPGARSVLAALLPRPKGMQIAGLLGDDVGLFTRVPTDNPVKARMLVALARQLIAGADDDDDDDDDPGARLLAGLDVAQTKDRRALLASYVLSGAQLESLVWD